MAADGRGTDGRFLWAVGIEDTFVPQVASRTGRVLDEYELTQHYRFWREDLARVAELGVSHIRYGIPWYRVNPAPGHFDWSWTDEVLPHLVERLHIEPIIDLMHYGCPLWLENEFINPAYSELVAEYAAAFAERYGDLVRFYTPLNEPRVNADFCGRNGIWPPYLRGDRGYVRVFLALARGMSLTVDALRARDPAAIIVQVEASACVGTEDPALEEQVAIRSEQQFLATDLLRGSVNEDHPLEPWLRRNGAASHDLDWFRAHPQTIDVMGVNFYPRFSCWTIAGTPGAPRRKQRWGTAADLERVLTEHHRRFGLPVMLTETSEKARVSGRERWLDESVAAVGNVRGRGVQVIGYTWFPVLSLVAWSYRRGRRPIPAYLYHMGLWDLRDDGAGTLERQRTRLVDRYAALVAAGAEAVNQPNERAVGAA